MISKALREIYKVVLKDNIRIEYVKEDDDVFIYSRDYEDYAISLYVVLSPDSKGLMLI
ncbi:hypothetical protein LCGC14_1647470 [marine sediment metagenome]|uniref:Uncharacterized protein n=1 Tax=marine sediment metagenome TaxID=412755 RepID=A0A0F9HXT0_9ZZZZ